tara:strand:+ start:445 stop:666 length:222 start_codon:yes stop_codon:yes gene_type:complete
MIDGLAKRYGVLPSHLMAQGDTFDLMVMDVAISWERHCHNKQNGKSADDYEPGQLVDLMDKAKGKGNDSKAKV